MSGHLSMRPTWTSPSRVDGPAWPCTGRGLPGRRVTATPVRSYRTISPLPVRDSRVAAPSAVCFCGTFPRVSPGGRYPPPCPVVSGLSSRGFLSPRGPLGPPYRWYASGSVKPSIGRIWWRRCERPWSPEREADWGARSRSSSPAAATGSTPPTSMAKQRPARQPKSGDATSSALDVRDEGACRALADLVAHDGGLDLWVNNAGVLFTGLALGAGRGAAAADARRQRDRH